MLSSLQYFVYNVNYTALGVLIYEYIQKDATFHSLSYPETSLHVSGGGTTRNM
jgi:hypothetical protein